MNSAQIIPALAAIVAVLAAISDVKSRRIPNLLTYPALVAGLLLQCVLHGWRGLLLGAGGGLFFGGVFLLFYMVRAMGAGDVKLAAALGCIVGWPATLPVMIETALAGGVLAIIFMVLFRPHRGDVAEYIVGGGFPPPARTTGTPHSKPGQSRPRCACLTASHLR